MAGSGLTYPDRFYATAAYAGFRASGATSSSAISRFQNDIALLLYGLYQQATVGPCNVPKPRAWNPVEQSKWTSCVMHFVWLFTTAPTECLAWVEVPIVSARLLLGWRS
ncbi:hypothetical protein E2562_037122 [Oryza meyeriana var. granulata]|uniref:ACB domain-containing protein n=1 Tax=Oryza meyeriana var. granulata TaxID=110450 RepID=A0A6G1CCQ6_9ORYZ|nr:hypothetical protein E2562_037122 [Oryza meyeriana var. granulata]